MLEGTRKPRVPSWLNALLGLRRLEEYLYQKIQHPDSSPKKSLALCFMATLVFTAILPMLVSSCLPPLFLDAPHAVCEKEHGTSQT